MTINTKPYAIVLHLESLPEARDAFAQPALANTERSSNGTALRINLTGRVSEVNSTTGWGGEPPGARMDGAEGVPMAMQRRRMARLS
jgi:hypothetical protein